MVRFNVKTNRVTETTTICYNCEHHFCKEPRSSPRADVWYNQICLASPLPTKIDPVTGKIAGWGVNDFGTGYVSDNGFEYCRDVNDGNCPKFLPK